MVFLITPAIILILTLNELKLIIYHDGMENSKFAF